MNICAHTATGSARNCMDAASRRSTWNNNRRRHKEDLTIHRIVAVRDFGNVKKGDKGGWVECEENLSHEGDCWIAGDACVCGDAQVCDNARVYNHARVYGEAQVYDSAKVCGNARVYGEAKVFDDTKHGSGEITT